MKRAKDEEFKIQAAFINYVRLAHPNVLLTISPAGFIMSAGMAMKMSRMGYTKGTPDVMFFEPRGCFHGLFIEFKTPKGKTQPSQVEFITKLQARGYWCNICRSSEEGITALEEYLALSHNSLD